MERQAACSVPNRRFEFQKRSQLFIRTPSALIFIRAALTVRFEMRLAIEGQRTLLCDALRPPLQKRLALVS
jgi:hypothetical protein